MKKEKEKVVEKEENESVWEIVKWMKDEKWWGEGRYLYLKKEACIS